MKKTNRTTLRNLCIVAGCALIVGALALLILSVASRSLYRFRCAEYVSAIGATLPPVENAVPEPGRNNTMPVLPVEGVDFVALLELPAFQTRLPVCNQWGSPEKYPCRFTGSAYDGTLIVGVEEHLFPAAEQLYVGDLLTLTDMTGNRFSYRIANIEIHENVEAETLQDTDHPLTLFVKHSFSSKYTVLRLDVAL